MEILGISHIGIVAKDTKQAKLFFGSILKLPDLGDEIVEEQKTVTSMFSSSKPKKVESEQEQEGNNHSDSSEGESDQHGRIELLQAHNDEGPIASYLAKKGPGIHHLALRVADINKSIAILKEQQVKLIDNQWRPGAHNTKVAFVHPHSTGGILVELVEHS